MPTIPEILVQAVAHHQAGRLSVAEEMYRQVLAVDPHQPDALHLLGILALDGGRHNEAIDFINRAIQRKANFPDFHINLARAHRALRNFPEAIASCRRALQLSPFFAEAHNNLGNALANLPGRQSEAVAHYQAALRIKPDDAQAQYNLGVVLSGMPGQLPEALSHFEAALRIRPDFEPARQALDQLRAR